jgi:hypothetical protein
MMSTAATSFTSALLLPATESRARAQHTLRAYRLQKQWAGRKDHAFRVDEHFLCTQLEGVIRRRWCPLVELYALTCASLKQSRKVRGEEEKECVLLEVEDEEEEDGALVSHLSSRAGGVLSYEPRGKGRNSLKSIIIIIMQMQVC